MKTEVRQSLLDLDAEIKNMIERTQQLKKAVQTVDELNSTEFYDGKLAGLKSAQSAIWLKLMEI